MHMPFASIFVPDFMVQAVVRAESSLRGRALVLLEGTASTRSVIALNAAAERMGVKLGMTKSQAQQFGEMEVRERSPSQEKTAHAALLDLGWSVSPRVEDTEADTIVLDLAGLASLFGSEEAIAARLAEGAARLGFTTQIATAANLDAAILVSRAFAGITVIPAGEEAAVVGKVPIGALAFSLEILETLERWGVHTCAALAALPVLQLSERLGQDGVRLHELARARSTRAMVLAQPAIYFEEELELEHAEAELEPLAFLLGRLLDALCARLAERSLAAGAIRVRFELEPSGSMVVIPLESESPGYSPSVYERTLCLAVPTANAKMLLKLLTLHLQADAPSAPVRKIALAAEAARPRVAQGGLFCPISPDPEKVELTIARLAKLVGSGNIGSPELLDTHRPEGFRMLRFAPNRDAGDTRRRGRRTTGNMVRIANVVPGFSLTDVEAPPDASPAPADVAPGLSPAHADLKVGATFPKGCQTVFRVFRPPLPARVEVRQGCPAWVAFTGVRGRVVAASGPWRGSGNWWSEDAWQSDEWDLEIQLTASSPTRLPGQAANPGAKAKPQRGLYRLFYDLARKEWFARGAYD
jgi:protein ImuB